MRENCPSLEALAQSLEGRWNAHAAQCPACAELLEELRRDQCALQTAPEIPEEVYVAVRQAVMARIPVRRYGRYAWVAALAASLFIAAMLHFQPQHLALKPPRAPEVPVLSVLAVSKPSAAKLLRPHKAVPKVQKAVEPPLDLDLLEALLATDQKQESPSISAVSNSNVVAIATKDPDVKILLVPEVIGGVQ